MPVVNQTKNCAGHHDALGRFLGHSNAFFRREFLNARHRVQPGNGWSNLGSLNGPEESRIDATEGEGRRPCEGPGISWSISQILSSRSGALYNTISRPFALVVGIIVRGYATLDNRVGGG
ncbi:hypothetical protein I7I51_00326 [Histoplasma capsulatum]|uniref:Uncharacterized protein n=1 Tax=Ajellomyces capsulatus TaxID=5037 RepID=A0A8A1MBF5_AJECA|nr:hypothetical protein I7I51_00326 [Histoplasma capsulatum]